MTISITNNYSSSITEQDIQRFESMYQISLPEVYRNFLLQTNGGRPDKDLFPTPNDERNEYLIVNYFYGLNYRRETWGDLSYKRKTFTDRIPDDLLAIAGDPGGNQICLGLTGERFGKIFIWDMEQESDEEPPMYDNVSFVANSFQELLEGLYTES